VPIRSPPPSTGTIWATALIHPEPDGFDLLDILHALSDPTRRRCGVGIDLSRAVWRKSSYSNGSGGDCVQVALGIAEVVAVRDSKNPDGLRLVFSHEEWRAFVAAVRARELDL